MKRSFSSLKERKLHFVNKQTPSHSDDVNTAMENKSGDSGYLQCAGLYTETFIFCNVIFKNVFYTEDALFSDDEGTSGNKQILIQFRLPHSLWLLAPNIVVLAHKAHSQAPPSDSQKHC